MAQLLTKSAQQKDNMCGSFCTARILNGFGFASLDGEPIDEDQIAIRAGATLPDPDLPACLPPGAVSRTGYRYEHPAVSLDEVGTTPAGLIKAIEETTQEGLHAIPIRGAWTADGVEHVVERATACGARLIANLHTGSLWGSHPSADQLVAELSGKQVTGPPPDWAVGHFVELTMLVRGSSGSLVVVHDTYPSLGWEGFHLQPPRMVAAALMRGDGREGGILGVVEPERAKEVAAIVGELGLEVGVWDNGCRS